METPGVAGMQRVPLRMLPLADSLRTFDEQVLGYPPDAAITEARRADGYSFAAATAACPFHVDIRRFVSAIGGGRFDEARAIIQQSHPWPGVLGRQCHQHCELALEMPEGIEPFSIRALERAAADHSDRSAVPFTPGAPTGASVAVVGCGSAGVGCAYELRRRGHHVVVFDQLPVPGGMLAVGYPWFRMPRDVVWAENNPAVWGAEIRHGTRVGPDLIQQLMRDYDAVFIGIGRFKPARLDIPGADLAGVMDALSYLRRVEMGDPPPIGQQVLVVGAGYTASDVVGTVLRLGSQPLVMYRRTMEEMPVRPRARAGIVGQWNQMGIRYEFLATPVRILDDGARHVQGVECVRMALGAADASGRPAPYPIEGSSFIVPCDTVIEATGEEIDRSVLPKEFPLRDSGHLWVDPETRMCSIPRIFAAGDVVGDFGTDGAYAGGMRAGRSIDTYLRGDRAWPHLEPSVDFDPYQFYGPAGPRH